MTRRKTATRSIDNRRLFSLQIGEVFMTNLGVHVAWEAYGERAALILADRRAGLIKVVSQPEKLRLHVSGKSVAYTPDYEMTFSNERIEVVEVKGEEQLKDEYVQEKLAAAELEIVKTNRHFVVLNSRQLNAGNEFRNVQLLRRYSNFSVSTEQTSSILSVFKEHFEIPLSLLAETVSTHAIGRAHIYALLYRGVLDHDWHSFISDESQIRKGENS